jgi:chemotaxis protein histidine kinase CheA
MDDHDERDSRTTPLGARVRNALGAVREQGAASLRGVRRSAAGATDRLKSTPAGERLSAAVETRRVVRKATEAQRRGNHPMAYRLLEPEVRENPDDARLVTAFWSAALACERVEDAVPALLRIIRKLASTGEPERAAELWLELRDAAPSALVDPSSLVRMVPALEADGRSEQVTQALREAVDPRNDSGLSPGLAGRIAEMAHQTDPPTALTAARRALTSPDLHETKRARLRSLVAELEKAGGNAAAEAPAEESAETPASPPEELAEAPAAMAEEPAEAPAAPPEERAEAPAVPAEEPAEALAAPAEEFAEAPAAPPEERAEAPAVPAEEPAEDLAEAPAAPPEERAEAPAVPAATTADAEVTKRAVDDAEVTNRAVDDALEALAPTARFSDIKVMEAMPTKLREEAVALQLLAGRKVGIDYAKIEAVAVAEVRGLADYPVVVIDLVLNWGDLGDSTLRVARLRSDGFDPRMVTAAPTDRAEALRSFLSELLARSNAVPLPDPDSALGLNVRAFDDLEAYQHEVLRVEP